MSDSYFFEGMIGTINQTSEVKDIKDIKLINRDNEKFYKYNVEGIWYSIIKCATYRIVSTSLLVGSYDIPKPLEEVDTNVED